MVEKAYKYRVYPNNYDLCKMLTILKSENTWLKEPDKCALQNSLKDLDYAFKRFFKVDTFSQVVNYVVTVIIKTKKLKT